MRIFLFIVSLCLAGPLVADDTFTISELVDIALKNNPETKQAWWHAHRAAAALDSKKSAYYPRIDLETDLTTGKEYTSIPGQNPSHATIGATLTLSMLLFDFGERSSSVCAAREALIAAQWQSNWAMQNVMIKVLESSYSVNHAQETLQANQISLKEAENLLAFAKDLNQAGLCPVTDVYTSQANLSQMQMEIADKTAALQIQKGKLARALGISFETPITLAAFETPSLQKNQQVGDLVALAQKKRADLLAKRATLAESYALEEKAKSLYRPKLSITTNGSINRSLQHHTKNDSYEAILRLDIPLFVGFDSIYKNRMAYADMQITTEELAQLELDIALEVLTYDYALKAAQDKLELAATNLTNAKAAYEGVLEKYKAGKERIVDVSTVQQQLAQARILDSNVKTEWLIAIAKLAYATGSLMEAP